MNMLKTKEDEREKRRESVRGRRLKECKSQNKEKEGMISKRRKENREST